MANRPMLPVESRMQGDLQVRFGGRLEETYRRKAARRFLPSLHFYIFECGGKNLLKKLRNFILFANSKMVPYIPTKMKQI